MEFVSDFSFETNDGFGDSSQSISRTPVGESFSLGSEFSTPTSERSAPHALDIAFDCADKSLGSSDPDLTSPPGLMFTLTHNTKCEPLSNSVTNNYSMATPHRDTFFEMSMAAEHSIGSADSDSLTMHAISPQVITKQRSLTMIPTPSLSGSEMASLIPSISTSDESAICPAPESFFLPVKENIGELHLDLEICRNRAPLPPGRLCSRPKITYTQPQSTELQQIQKQTRCKVSVKTETVAANAACQTKQACDYPGCRKAFRRREHLKRHKQCLHGEGPNRFSCEFCGKGQFNRKDNLNTHRKLHARFNNRYRGVKFIPAAVAIIEQEKRSRMREK